MPMNARHRRFCEEYLLDLNATQAYLRAGYKGSETTARKNASKLLTNTDVVREIERLQALRAERVEIDADAVLQELGVIAFSSITDVLRVEEGNRVVLLSSEEWPENARKAVQSARQSKDGFSIRMHSKTEALGKLMQHFGMLSDLNIALATLATYGTLTKTEDGYQLVMDKGA